MRTFFQTGFLILALLGLGQNVWPSETGEVRVEGGILKPFYPPSPKEKEFKVHSFWMDKFAVSNEQFLEFVKSHPEWRRDRIKRIFADVQYLTGWAGPESLGAGAEPQQPVTDVSWFAAKAYCEAEHKRLPTENEWEYAAQASEKEANGRSDMAWRQKVLDWYTRPSPPKLPRVDEGTPNFFGITNLHGLIWEWVLDFNSSLISSDSRENATSPDKNRFCGAGALVATEKDDYASFMRLSFRTSLKAGYTTKNLGFRCAHDE